jgi:hypothetical protein
MAANHPDVQRMREVLIEECSAKHFLDPRESDINGDYHVEITLSVDEIRRFLIATARSAGDGFPVGSTALVPREEKAIRESFEHILWNTHDAVTPKRLLCELIPFDQQAAFVEKYRAGQKKEDAQHGS